MVAGVRARHRGGCLLAHCSAAPLERMGPVFDRDAPTLLDHIDNDLILVWGSTHHHWIRPAWSPAMKHRERGSGKRRTAIDGSMLSPVVDAQIDHHLDLVTAIVARPEMTDFVVAHVRR